MTNAKHTTWPWRVAFDMTVTASKAGIVEGSKHIADCGNALRKDSENIANARRIVACVNACAGLANEQLDRVVKNPLSCYHELMMQRDELLAALEGAEKWLSGWASADPYLTVIRAAIAKARGE